MLRSDLCKAMIWLWLLLLTAPGCQSDAALGWTLGPLREILPLQARIDGARLRLEAVLVGWDGRALGPEDRVRTTAGTLRLKTLAPADARFDGQLRSQEGAADLSGAAVELVYHPEALPSRLVLLLDNSTAAAAADPGLARVAGSRAVVEALACQESCPLGPSEVSLLAMQGGAVATLAGASRDPQALDEDLQSLTGSIGGEAPLWDGLAQAVGLARAAPAGAVLCYTASGLGGPSTGTAADLSRLLGVDPRVRLVVVQQLGEQPELIAAAAQSGGLWLAVGRGGLEPTLRAAATSLRGSWELAWTLSSAPSGTDRLLGTLDVGLGPDRRATELDLPLLR